MSSGQPVFVEPTKVERVFNRFFGFLVGIGLGPVNSYLLQVRGRKSGRIYSTPVHLLKFKSTCFLVAPRGRTQWVRNAEATGEVSLKRGRAIREFRLRAVADTERPEILKAYLDTFESTVQRYFPMPAGSPVESFLSVAAYYPVFELRLR